MRCKMKRPTMLYQALLTQVSIDLEVSTERDYAYLRSRFEHEGLSFLTITLPALSDSLESGLESGRFTLPLGFKPRNRGGTLPAFLQGLFKRVFAMDGSLLPDACARSVYWIRQVARFFKKPKLPCTPAREAMAIRKYLAVEEDLNDATPTIKREDCILDSVAAILWSTIFPNVDDRLIVCRHGPGVTSDRRLSNERHRIRNWYQRFEASFPAADHAFPNWGQAWDGGSHLGIEGIEYLDVKDEIPVRVVFVPKTLQAPRVIAIEPSCMQYVQQGLSRYIVASVETHKLTRSSIRFTDQETNRRLAYEASIDRRLATIDLSDASDRVHNELVNRIFRRSPILDYLQDARSLHAVLPNGVNIILNKYASMGSALCFPVEACVFYTLILSAIITHTGRRPSYRTILSLSRDISVFGDDIIVPTKYVDVVSDYLESYALRVNRRKSFSRSSFRESCGADFYKGESVLPVYARMEAPARSSEWTPSHIMSWCATADQFYMAGSWHICQVIRDMVESVLRRRLPRSRVPTQGLGFRSLLFDTKLRWRQSSYSFAQHRLVFSPSKQKDKIDGDAAACFNKVFRTNHSDYYSRVLGRALDERDRLLSERCQHQSMVGESLPYESVPDDDLRAEPIVRYLASRCEESGPLRSKLYRLGARFPSSDSRVSYDHLGEPSFEGDFHNTTKRGVFALKRQWVTIFS
nr:MAG: RNA-dependent RNA polymerase [Hangzhou steitz-like virus 1]